MLKVIKSEDTVVNSNLVHLYEEAVDQAPPQEAAVNCRKSSRADTIDKYVGKIYEETRKRADLEAARTLEEAYARRDKIVNTAEQDVKRIKEQARQEGAARGLEEAAEQIQEALAGLNRTVDILRQEMADYKQKLSQQMIELALCTAEKILHKRVEENPMELLELAKDMILSEKDKENMQLHVSRDMAESVELLEQELEPLRERLQAVIKVKGEELPKGSLRLETSEGMIDGSVFEQLKNLRKQLLQLEEE